MGRITFQKRQKEMKTTGKTEDEGRAPSTEAAREERSD